MISFVDLLETENFKHYCDDIVFSDCTPGFPVFVEVDLKDSGFDVTVFSSYTGKKLFAGENLLTNSLGNFARYISPVKNTEVVFYGQITGRYIWNCETDTYIKKTIKTFKNTYFYISDFETPKELTRMDRLSDRYHKLRCLFEEHFGLGHPYLKMFDWKDVLFMDCNDRDQIELELDELANESMFGYIYAGVDQHHLSSYSVYGNGAIFNASVLGLQQKTDQERQYMLDAVNSDLEKFEAAPSLETLAYFKSDILDYYTYEELDTMFYKHSRLFIYNTIIKPFFERVCARYFRAECRFNGIYFEADIPGGIEHPVETIKVESHYENNRLTFKFVGEE